MSLVTDSWPHLDQCTHASESQNGFIVCNGRGGDTFVGTTMVKHVFHFYFLLMVETELKSTTSTTN
jgi:hypothetical protein